MYCRMCGKKIGDTDHFCLFCGAPTGNSEPASKPSEIPEEIIFNPPYKDKSHLTEEEELKEFISENEIEEAQHEEVQKKEEAEEPKLVKNQEFTWNVYEFPNEKKKTEDIEFNWNMEDFGQTEPKSPEKPVFEEELFQEIRDDSTRIKEKNIDRFFTFSKKNEEFQELLDKEYEKFKTRTEPVTEIFELKSLKEIPEEQPPAAPPAPQVKVIKESGIPEAVPLQEIHIQPEIKETEPAITEDEPELTEDELEIPEPETELMEDEPEPETTEPEEKTEVAEPEVEAEEETEAANPGTEPRAEHISEMEQARAQYFGEDLIRDNESIRKKLAPSEPEKNKTVEDYIKEEKEAENYIDTPAAEDTEEDVDQREESAAEENAAMALEKTEVQTPVPLTDRLAPTFGDEGEGEIEEDEKHKRSAGQIVLAIIAVILVIEIAILGIRYFAPESTAAQAIGNVQTEIFKTVSDWFDGGQENGPDNQEALPEDSDKNDQDITQKEEPQADDQAKAPEADPNPMADKNALVSSQMGNNKNIEQVKANEALAWKQGTNYGLSDINNSKPITNNIWKAPETGDPVYYDRSIVGTVIAFDSQWIDYMNSGDKSVLSLTKMDSEAYRKSVNYSKVGKIKETFRLLEIGEIRQGANGFYIWVHEEIGATENGKSSDIKYNWIYYLEPVDGQMKIVNYYQFK